MFHPEREIATISSTRERICNLTSTRRQVQNGEIITFGRMAKVTILAPFWCGSACPSGLRSFSSTNNCISKFVGSILHKVFLQIQVLWRTDALPQVKIWFVSHGRTYLPNRLRTFPYLPTPQGREVPAGNLGRSFTRRKGR